MSAWKLPAFLTFPLCFCCWGCWVFQLSHHCFSNLPFIHSQIYWETDSHPWQKNNEASLQHNMSEIHWTTGASGQQEVQLLQAPQPALWMCCQLQSSGTKGKMGEELACETSKLVYAGLRKTLSRSRIIKKCQWNKRTAVQFSDCASNVLFRRRQEYVLTKECPVRWLGHEMKGFSHEGRGSSTWGCLSFSWEEIKQFADVFGVYGRNHPTVVFPLFCSSCCTEDIMLSPDSALLTQLFKGA